MSFEDPEDLEGMFDTFDGFGVVALYRVAGQGDGVEVAVIRNAGDRGADIFGRATISEASGFLMLISEAPGLARDDTFEIGGRIHTVNAEPVRDGFERVWLFGAPPG